MSRSSQVCSWINSIRGQVLHDTFGVCFGGKALCLWGACFKAICTTVFCRPRVGVNTPGFLGLWGWVAGFIWEA